MLFLLVDKNVKKVQLNGENEPAKKREKNLLTLSTHHYIHHNILFFLSIE